MFIFTTSIISGSYIIYKGYCRHKRKRVTILFIIGVFSLLIFNKSMDLMLLNNYVNDEYSKLTYLKRNLNHEKKTLEVNLDKLYVDNSEDQQVHLEPSDIKKIELINKLQDWSDK